MTGGTFFRSYDGVSSGFTSQAYPATVSTFALDAYEITVGRFRQFVNSVNLTAWRPLAGSGKHSHLNDGNGLVNSALPASYEGGWDPAWDNSLGSNEAQWTSNLSCDAASATWTDAAGVNENRPINCLTWYEAYAFCIWDGGFLPSETEWNYAAAGGGGSDGQRVFPWSIPPTSTTIDCTYANYDPSGMQGGPCVAGGLAHPNAVGSESPKGDGKWGQSDLAGNVMEWTEDWYAPYVVPCSDCADLTGSATTYQVLRGGTDGYVPSPYLLTSTRYSGYFPQDRFAAIGARCARVP